MDVRTLKPGDIVTGMNLTLIAYDYPDYEDWCVAVICLDAKGKDYPYVVLALEPNGDPCGSYKRFDTFSAAVYEYERMLENDNRFDS